MSIQIRLKEWMNDQPYLGMSFVYDFPQIYNWNQPAVYIHWKTECLFHFKYCCYQYPDIGLNLNYTLQCWAFKAYIILKGRVEQLTLMGYIRLLKTLIKYEHGWKCKSHNLHGKVEDVYYYNTEEYLEAIGLPMHF